LESSGGTIAVALAPASLFQGGLEVVADDGVEHGLLGLAAAGAGRERRARSPRIALVLNPGRELSILDRTRRFY